MSVKKVVFNDSTGMVSVESSDGSTNKFNIANTVTATTSPSGVVELSVGGDNLNLVQATTSPGGEITDFNVDGKNIGLVQAVTNPDGGIELVADGENLNFVRSVASPGEGTRITNMISLTQAQYDALVTKDAATLYVIIEVVDEGEEPQPPGGEE